MKRGRSAASSRAQRAENLSTADSVTIPDDGVSSRTGPRDTDPWRLACRDRGAVVLRRTLASAPRPPARRRHLPRRTHHLLLFHRHLPHPEPRLDPARLVDRPFPPVMPFLAPYRAHAVSPPSTIMECPVT